jgi:hypothetical protein
MIEVPLYNENGEKMWSELDKSIDIIAIAFTPFPINGQFLLTAFNPKSVPSQNLSIDIGENVFVLGYPLGFHDKYLNLPILRTATIATQYPIPFGISEKEQRPFFLIDAHLHPGMSGSPVLLKAPELVKKEGKTSLLLGNMELYVLGINSGEYNVGGQPLGLHVVWFSSLFNRLFELSKYTVQLKYP